MIGFLVEKAIHGWCKI